MNSQSYLRARKETAIFVLWYFTAMRQKHIVDLITYADEEAEISEKQYKSQQTCLITNAILLDILQIIFRLIQLFLTLT